MKTPLMGWQTAILGVTLLFLFLTACKASTSSSEPPTVESAPPETAVVPPTPLPIVLEDLGPAPEIKNEIWLNTDQPITLASQRGKVVLLEFWTFGCINCQRTIPWVNTWHDTYTGDDFAVLSVHYPEFQYEREIENVAQALERYEITYPVAIDNERLTWGAYNQRFWPTTYLIDKQGHIRLVHIGEYTRGSDLQIEAAIEALMAEPDPVQ